MILVVLLLDNSSDPVVRGPFHDEDAALVLADTELLRLKPGKAFVFEENPCPGRRRFDIIHRLERTQKETP